MRACRAVLWDRSKAMGLTPYREENPNVSAQKPEGHDTHNLFVKDKKKKKHFLIMARQNAKINLKVNFQRRLGISIYLFPLACLIFFSNHSRLCEFSRTVFVHAGSREIDRNETTSLV